MREIAERLILDLVAFAVAVAQQMGSVFATLVGAPRGDDMNCSASLCHARITAVICGICQSFLVTTNCTRKNCTYSVNRPTTCALGSQMKGELQPRARTIASELPPPVRIFIPSRSARRLIGRLVLNTCPGPCVKTPMRCTPLYSSASCRCFQ